jgi:CCR4-NOT transcription complex subunit 6
LQDNVALIAVLEMAPDPERSSKQLICVANTHIHANPELNDVKLWQVHTLLKGLEKIANRCAAAAGAQQGRCSVL